MSTNELIEWDCARSDYTSRDEWLRARRSLIGASDSPAIFGEGYAGQSQVSVWYEKVYGLTDHEVAKRLRIGSLMEPSLRAIFTEETGLPCTEAGQFTIYRHPEIDWIGATLDGVTDHPEYGPCPVELKNISSFNRYDWEGEPPLKYNVQVQHQLAVTGATHGYLFGLIGGDTPVVRLINRYEPFIESMIQGLEKFWDYVQRKELPPIDQSKATARVLSQIYPEDTGEVVELPRRAVVMDHQREEAIRQLKDAEKLKTWAENQIKALMGDATEGVLPDGSRYTWKAQTRSSYTVPEATYRVLRKRKK